jgi:hypothetical protein
MKYKFLLFCCGLLSTFHIIAQRASSTAFAITSQQEGGFAWTDVKLIDLNTGKVLKNIFENNKGVYNVYNARTGKKIEAASRTSTTKDGGNFPFSSLSAACAYDRKHQRLYFTPMFVNQLRYIDLKAKEPTVYYFDSENLSTATDFNNEANHMTRMVIAVDGYGYALNNEGTHLVRFSTGKKPQITDLGPVNDDASNGSESIRIRNSGWGGDMIADASGDLYVISAFHSVFRINIDRMTATFISKIQGLPQDYTTNGAAVDEEGNIIVSSANSVKTYYRVDMSSWTATPLQGGGDSKVFNTSDLANSNFCGHGSDTKEPASTATLVVKNPSITVYPNPVTRGNFAVNFSNDLNGRFDIQLLDINGRVMLQDRTDVHGVQAKQMSVGDAIAKGTYFVRVLNNNKKVVFADMLIVQ